MRTLHVAVLLIALAACATPPPVTDDPKQALTVDNRHDGRFFNPWDPLEFQYGAIWDQLFKPNRYAGQDFGPVPRAEDAVAQLAAAGTDSVTWIGHATMMIREDDDVVLTDPHLSNWALLARRKTAPGLRVEQLPRPSFAVISHNHYDHLDKTTVKALPADMLWLVPSGLKAWFAELGRHNVIERGWWETAEAGGWQVSCVPVQHWSRRIGQPTNSTLWCGWILESPRGRRHFFAGDTGYFHGFKEIARRFGPIDTAMLPIGAYYPESFLGYQHMSPGEALQAFEDLQARVMLPMHWGSFKLTLEPIAEPAVHLQRLVNARPPSRGRVRILALGETWNTRSLLP